MGGSCFSLGLNFLILRPVASKGSFAIKFSFFYYYLSSRLVSKGLKVSPVSMQRINSALLLHSDSSMAGPKSFACISWSNMNLLYSWSRDSLFYSILLRLLASFRVLKF